MLQKNAHSLFPDSLLHLSPLSCEHSMFAELMSLGICLPCESPAASAAVAGIEPVSAVILVLELLPHLFQCRAFQGEILLVLKGSL